MYRHILYKHVVLCDYIRNGIRCLRHLDFMYAVACVCVQNCAYTYIQTYTHIQTFTYIHTYTHIYNRNTTRINNKKKARKQPCSSCIPALIIIIIIIIIILSCNSWPANCVWTFNMYELHRSFCVFQKLQRCVPHVLFAF